LKDRRNEALDTSVYAEAIAHHPAVRVHAMRDADWQKLRDVYEPANRVQQDLFLLAPQVVDVSREKTPELVAQQMPTAPQPDWLGDRVDQNWIR
jgi:phage terminase large subunit GpA-like protein